MDPRGGLNWTVDCGRRQWYILIIDLHIHIHIDVNTFREKYRDYFLNTGP